MDNKIYLISLYDLYIELFTDKQRMYFESYYYDDLSLSEIADNYEISRNAAYKQIKEVEKKLLYYEECLKLNDKRQKILNLIKDEKLKNKILDIL